MILYREEGWSLGYITTKSQLNRPCNALVVLVTSSRALRRAWLQGVGLIYVGFFVHQPAGDVELAPYRAPLHISL